MSITIFVVDVRKPYNTGSRDANPLWVFEGNALMKLPAHNLSELADVLS
jgi:hypothetical protein